MVVVAGALAQRPDAGGHAWVFLNWLLGLQAAGCDVLFVDRLEPSMLAGPDTAPEDSPQWRWLERVMTGAGLAGRFALLYDRGRVCLGMARQEVLRRCRQAPVLLNFMGYLDDDEVLAAAGRRVFVDIDPGFPQMWRSLGLHDAFAGHDAFVTVGLAVGQPGCPVPDHGLDWLVTPPPVALSHWPVVDLPPGVGPGRVTSVCTWRGPNGPINYEGEHYGLRVHEFRRFLGIPATVRGATFELALAIEPGDDRDATALGQQGWCLVDPQTVAGDPGSYRSYVHSSAAELCVAKGLYVRSRGGWFSDRSACYLASGRPVVAQDTGWGVGLPSGEGLLSFSDADGAADALAEVTGNWSRHAKAARGVAEEFLDAARVLPPLLARLGVA